VHDLRIKHGLIFTIEISLGGALGAGGHFRVLGRGHLA
jgi:hypothetical protein